MIAVLYYTAKMYLKKCISLSCKQLLHQQISSNYIKFSAWQQAWIVLINVTYGSIFIRDKVRDVMWSYWDICHPDWDMDEYVMWKLITSWLDDEIIEYRNWFESRALFTISYQLFF